MPPILCPNCRKLIGSEEKKCYHCGTPRSAQYSPQYVLFKDNGLVTSIIIGSCVVLYLGSLLLNPAHVMRMQGGIFNIGSPHSDALYLLGMTGGSAWYKGHIWTLLSASFLHGSLLHILFNMSWFNTLAKMSNALLGPARMTVCFILTGVSGFLLSNIASALLHPSGISSPTIGASCSIFGLMGLLIVFGHRRGGVLGKQLNRQIWAWAIIGLALGFAMPGINNWGHIGGLLGGLGMGFVMPSREGYKEGWGIKGLAVFLLVLSIASVILSIAFNGYLRLKFQL
ncbi:MAG: rhomboid family intramembrane serine protease [Myxococcota bacterium]|nr:rhomboid family intramembrane serine protease [Myxococcota bacterium]